MANVFQKQCEGMMVPLLILLHIHLPLLLAQGLFSGTYPFNHREITPCIKRDIHYPRP
jgi:hypothetical protein